MKGEGCFIRARKPEEIAQRRDSILAATARLLAQQAPDQLSLNAIAREARLAKSNVYRYFESREAIYLALLMQDLDGWVEDVKAVLAPLAGSNQPATVAAVLATATVARPRLCQLVSLLGNVLERNLSEQAVLAFKQESLQRGLAVLSALQAALPAVDTVRLQDFMAYFLAQVGGLWPVCHPAPLVEKVLQRPELSLMRRDFADSLTDSLQLMLAGLLAEAG